MEFKIDVKSPFAALINELTGAVGETWDTREDKTKDLLLRLTAYEGAGCHLNRKVDKAFTPAELNAALKKEKLPFMVMVKQCAEGDGYQTYPGTEYDIFEIRPDDSHCDNMAINSDHLERYLRGIKGQPIMATKIGLNLQAITYLMNATYGPFFIDEPKRIYGTGELNMMMEHRCIPFYFKQDNQMVLAGMGIPTFTVMEVKW